MTPFALPVDDGTNAYQRVFPHVFFTVDASDTALPLELASDAVFCRPTGPVVIVPPAHSVVEASFRIINALGSLGIDPLDEAIVERALRRNQGSPASRSISSKK